MKNLNNQNLEELKEKLDSKRKKLINDPNIPSQKVSKMLKEMQQLHNQIKQLESEVRNHR